MKNSLRFGHVGCAFLCAFLICHNQLAFAGWTGYVNGLGIGWASVDVRSSTSKTNRVITVNNLPLPSATMPLTSGYKTNGPLPSGASLKTYSRIKAISGASWQAAANAAIGDGTDNPELQQRINIVPSDCAFISFESNVNQTQEEFGSTGIGSLSVTAEATAGTALWLRGFEYTGPMDAVPIDDPNTVENEGIEYLKANGLVKFETLILGPFQFGGESVNCPLIIPFTLNSTNLEHLVLATDGVALSLPLVLNCPPNVVATCDEPVTYPPVTFAGCGNIEITYSVPPINGSFPPGFFPVGVTPVTVTATDANGETTNCTFTVTVTDTKAPVPPSLPTLYGTCSTPVTLVAPVATDECRGEVTGQTTNAMTISTFGTHTVVWTFADGNGNTATANQTVVIGGLEFHGFYPPISGTGGSCSQPLRTATVGNNVPVKFDVTCGASSFNTGTPSLSIERSSEPNDPCGPLSPTGGGAFTLVGSEWHFNWNTSGNAKGNYKLTVTLQDGTTRSVWIRLK